MTHNTTHLVLSRQLEQQQKPAPGSSKAAIAKQIKSEAIKVERMELLGKSGKVGVVYTTAADGLTGVASYANGKGEPCACGFRGKSMKTAFIFKFHTPENRDKYVADWLQTANASFEEKQARELERKKPHTLKIGDVLYSSWGYDQTNIDFYEVVAVRGGVVDLVELMQDRKERGGMQGTCMPRKGEPKADPIRGKRPDGENRIRLSSFQSARPWDGRAMNWSSYA